tara:strand:- start:37 stop:501 length:465 start_codon:yes stop_codon:yes gene_type:complete
MTAIHTKEVRLFPVRCKNRSCSAYGQRMYLPFSERRKRWELLDEAAHKCLGCEKPYGLCAVVHLLTPDENGQVHGSLETSMGVFVEHPNKRWEFICDNSKRGYQEQKDSIDYPYSFTPVPSAATCYDCLEKFSKLGTEEKEEVENLMAYFRSKE